MSIAPSISFKPVLVQEKVSLHFLAFYTYSGAKGYAYLVKPQLWSRNSKPIFMVLLEGGQSFQREIIPNSILSTLIKYVRLNIKDYSEFDRVKELIGEIGEDYNLELTSSLPNLNLNHTVSYLKN
mgnify:FL=1